MPNVRSPGRPDRADGPLPRHILDRNAEILERTEVLLRELGADRGERVLRDDRADRVVGGLSLEGDARGEQRCDRDHADREDEDREQHLGEREAALAWSECAAKISDLHHCTFLSGMPLNRLKVMRSPNCRM